MCALEGLSFLTAQAEAVSKCLPSPAETEAWNIIKDVPLSSEAPCENFNLAGTKTSACTDKTVSADIFKKVLAYLGIAVVDDGIEVFKTKAEGLTVIENLSSKELDSPKYKTIGDLIKTQIERINYAEGGGTLFDKVVVADRIKRYLNEQSEADLQKLFDCKCPKESILEDLFVDKIKNAPRSKGCGSAKLPSDDTAKYSKILEPTGEMGVKA